jgi:hypothetical protein
MAKLITGANISLAWLGAFEYLLSLDGGETVNLAVCIEDPLSEVAGIRSELDKFIDARRRESKRAVERISTVANTLFPIAFYRPALGPKARTHLYEMEKLNRPMSRRSSPKGTYFERLVAWRAAHGEFNQLEQVVTRLTKARARGHKRGNAYELGLRVVANGDLAGEDLPTYSPGSDNSVMGFPCLSHVSLSLMQGRLHMTAIYRNHHFLKRAYGNYVGLGRLLSFIAKESGWEIGELMSISSHADANIGHGEGFGKQQINALVKACQQSLDAAAGIATGTA